MRSKTAWIAVVLLGIGMVLSQYLDFIASPPERLMGNVVRIMYFHIASATDAFVAFFVTALCGVIYLILRIKNAREVMKIWDTVAGASAQIGLLFTTFVLVTGSIWGRAVWNTWWTWDPTLTTTLILWFLYVGYILLRVSIPDSRRAATVSAVYGLIAALDVPIIHQSVTWWSGLHPSVITDSGFNMPDSMVVTLLFSFLVFLGLYVLLVYMGTALASKRAQIDELRERIRVKLNELDERV